MSKAKLIEELKKEVSYGYFVDEEGLYYYSEKDGEVEEFFSINGVATISLNYNEIKLLHLAYIYEDGDNTKLE